MKKTITLVSLLFGCFMAAQAQGNLFSADDLDSNGWLWFDTQEKIDKYVGDAGSDKPIKSIPTLYREEVEPDVFESLSNRLSPDEAGAGTDGFLPDIDENGVQVGADAKHGAIILAPNQGIAVDNANGGGILLQLPSCYYFSLYLSSEGAIAPTLEGADGKKESLDCVRIKGYSTVPLTGGPLQNKGQCEWEIQDLTNATTGLTLNHETPVTAYIKNGSKAEMYIHGMKILVYGEGAGISATAADDNCINIAQTGRYISLSRPADVTVYNTCGTEVMSLRAEAFDAGQLRAGVYIIQARDNGATTTRRILLP